MSTQPNPASRAQSGLPTEPQPDLARPPELDTSTRPQPTVDPDPGGRHYVVAAMAFAMCVLAGMAALVHSYLIAQTTLTSTSEFAWFWVGMILLELPLAVLIARRVTPRPPARRLLTLYGWISYAPKLLRNPASPLYHDEFAHWRATYDILSTGKLFQPDPIIRIISRYPGLHATTAALVHATGLTIWQAATLLLVIFHVSLVLGIATLAQSLGLSNRTALDRGHSVRPELVIPVLRHAIRVRVDGDHAGRVGSRGLCSGDPLTAGARTGRMERADRDARARARSSLTTCQ